MPSSWSDTVETHRLEIRDAVLDTMADLVDAHGLTGVTMSEVAARTGIGRATLYRYFSDVDAVLHAWHERHVEGHLKHLREVRDEATDASSAFEQVLRALSLHIYQARNHRGTELAALVHSGPHIAGAHEQLNALLQEVVSEAITKGAIRDDIPPAEIAAFCRQALGTASSLSSKAALDRLMELTLSALRPR